MERITKYYQDRSRRVIKSSGQTQQEARYYISSLKMEADKLHEKIRDHWKVEHSLHWVLDVAFKEDQKPCSYLVPYLNRGQNSLLHDDAA